MLCCHDKQMIPLFSVSAASSSKAAFSSVKNARTTARNAVSVSVIMFFPFRFPCVQTFFPVKGDRSGFPSAEAESCESRPSQKARRSFPAQTFSFPFHLCHPCKNLLPPHIMFDFCLSVPDQVVAFSMDTTDPMHHKLPARPLIKYDIALSQLPLRGTKKCCPARGSETAPCCSRKSPSALLSPALPALLAFNIGAGVYQLHAFSPFFAARFLQQSRSCCFFGRISYKLLLQRFYRILRNITRQMIHRHFSTDAREDPDFSPAPRSQRFMVICPYRLVNASAGQKPPRLVQLRLAQHHDASDWQFFVFADLRRSADRPAICCPRFAVISKQCLITVYSTASPVLLPKPACVVLPVPDGAEKSMAPLILRYAQCRIRHGRSDRRRSSAEKRQKYNLIFCNSIQIPSPDKHLCMILCRLTIQCIGTLFAFHTDQAALQPFPVTCLPADRPGLQVTHPPPPEVYRQ